MPLAAPQLEHIFSYRATLAPPEPIGPVAEGLRINFYVTGGEVWGPKLHGKIRPVGGDWLTLRQDGVAILDVRGTIETTDGALVYTEYRGVIDLGPEGYQQFLAGNVPPQLHLRIAPRYLTAHPAYQWLNRLQCVGIGEGDMATNTVAYDIYALR
ncbi:MAG TPA: DUF3237 domain-containing protein [Solibacterales bacterium]|nr:DUF3237 domain-containing protein [Bryobacterales bacterium]